MQKQKILESVDSNTKREFQTLWNRIEKEFGPEIALEFCQIMASDRSKYYDTLFSPYQTIIESFASEEKHQISHQKPQIHEQDPLPIKKIKVDVLPIKIMVKNPQIIQENMQSEQKVDETPNHLKQIKLNLQKDKEEEKFAPNFEEQDFVKFYEFYNLYKVFSLYGKDQLVMEAKRSKFQKNDINQLLEQLLLVDSALYHSSPKHRLRVTQIMAIYAFFQKPNLKTVLFQILTGQGKSTTIACLAAILTMRGRYVDIITTNNILAKRDVEEKKQFFNLLGLKVDHNITPQSDQSNQTAYKPKACYEKGTVVYGTPFSYQVDLLFDRYRKFNTRNGRPFDVAIIDEVDSMFIDEKGNQTLLSSTFGGFSDLILPMKILWQTVAWNNIIKEGDKLILYKQGAVKGEIIKGQMNEVMKIIVEDIREVFKNEIIPQWRKDFIDCSMNDWIWSAIQAAHVYKEDEHYVIENNKIIPVDYRNTGCLQHNVEWQHGLHQFLQIKHGLEVTVESMTSNFISSIGHFTRYKTIYGLTGTLGSKESKKFLQKIYQAQMLEIPPFLERRLLIQQGYFMYSDFQWIQKILQRVTEMMKKNRSVLIICQIIRHAKVIEEAIKSKMIPNKQIRCYFTGQQNHSDNVGCQVIIIATNVAGRGMDLKASKELVQNGGLHVIISFMPENLRVQMQACGRAGRNGAPGTGELIVNHMQYFEDIMFQPIDEQIFRDFRYENLIDVIRQDCRNQLEAIKMQSDLLRVQELETLDQAFQYFCNTVEKIEDYQDNKGKRDAIEENWAMFLKKAKFWKFSNKDFLDQAKELIKQFADPKCETFYNHSHTVWRGVNEINKNNFYQANAYFKSLDVPDSTTNNKIASKLMQASINIMLDDRKTKPNYQNNYSMMGQCAGLIQKRKDVLVGSHSVDLTLNNCKIVDVMNDQNKNESKKLLKSLQKDKIQLNPIKNIRLPSNILHIKNEKIEPIEQKRIEEMMNIPEINVLNSLGEHIDKQMSIIKSVKPNQYVDIKLEPLSKIIDMKKDKEKNTEEAVNKLMTDIPYVPVAQIKQIQQIKKAKVPWWKRLFVFAVGVIQICIGALIVGASGGGAASFGSYMMITGFQQCIQSIFTPQVCRNLQKFYTDTAIEYTFAIATLGVQGITELAKTSENGFQLIKNSTMSQVINKAMTGIKSGLINGAFNVGAILKKAAFMGLSSKLGGKKMIVQDIKETFKVLQKPQVSKFIDKFVENKDELKKIQQDFESEAQIMIKKIVSEEYSRFINEIKNLKIYPRHIRIMIKIRFQEEFRKHFGEKEGNQIYKKMLLFLKTKLTEKNLASKVITQFKIDQLIRTTIQNMGKSSDDKTVMENIQLEFKNQICEAHHAVQEKYKQQMMRLNQELKAESEKINTDKLILSEHQKRVKQFNEKRENYLRLEKNLQAFAQEFKKMDSEENIASYLIKKKVIVDGRIDKNSNNFKYLHPYSIEALSKISNIQTGQNEFKQCLEAQAFNSFTEIVVKAVTEIIDNSGCSISRLKTIEQKIKENMQKP